MSPPSYADGVRPDCRHGLDRRHRRGFIARPEHLVGPKVIIAIAPDRAVKPMVHPDLAAGRYTERPSNLSVPRSFSAAFRDPLQTYRAARAFVSVAFERHRCRHGQLRCSAWHPPEPDHDVPSGAQFRAGDIEIRRSGLNCALTPADEVMTTRKDFRINLNANGRILHPVGKLKPRQVISDLRCAGNPSAFVPLLPQSLILVRRRADPGQGGSAQAGCGR